MHLGSHLSPRSNRSVGFWQPPVGEDKQIADVWARTTAIRRAPRLTPLPFPVRGCYAWRLASLRRDYDRARDLARLLPLWPAEIANPTPEGRKRVVAKLEKALREERRRGIAGHWGYDLARHESLHRAYRHELALAMRSLRGGASLIAGGGDGSRAAAAGAICLAAFRAPSSSPVESGQPHNSGRPWDSSAAGSILHGIDLETSCIEFGDAVSAT